MAGIFQLSVLPEYEQIKRLDQIVLERQGRLDGRRLEVQRYVAHDRFFVPASTKKQPCHKYVCETLTPYEALGRKSTSWSEVPQGVTSTVKTIGCPW